VFPNFSLLCVDLTERFVLCVEFSDLVRLYFFAWSQCISLFGSSTGQNLVSVCFSVVHALLAVFNRTLNLLFRAVSFLALFD
jgi:hypothetical protein